MSTTQSILSAVQDKYGAVARSNLSNESAAVRSVAKAFGYSAEDLASRRRPIWARGNPVALAGLREGEVVVDLGRGGGLDVLPGWPSVSARPASWPGST
ncbi:MAG: hypothetical protein U0992_09175 [Planctomycetaceae bacterium]